MSTVTTTRPSLGDIKWGDVDYDDDTHISTPASAPQSVQGQSMPAAPATIVGKVDSHGIRTVTEYVTNEKGQKIKITKKLKTMTKMVKVNKNVLARQKWPKFGLCAGLPPGPEPNVTYTSIEVINLDLRPKKREEEKEESSLDKLSTTASVIICRNCGETGHWTLKCPKRTEIRPFGESMPEESSTGGASGSGSGATAAAGTAGKYVPMHMRAGGTGDTSGGYGVSSLRDDSSTLRVTNLSEDTTESDLSDLFRRFGHTSRIYLAKDRQTNKSRGFAFVSYTNKHDAQNAIDKLNGYGYDNLILHVEWAQPREQKPNDGQGRDS